jgi:hypothetical protein
MSHDHASMSIFFEGEDENTILSEEFTISKRISGDDSDRANIDKKRIKCEFEGMFFSTFSSEYDDLSR